MNSAQPRLSGRPQLLSDLPLAIAFVLLVCCGASGVWLFWQQRSADAWVHHTFEVENQLSQVQIEGLTLGVAIRTSIMARGDGTDVDLRAGRQNYFAHLDDLRKLTADNPSQMRRLEELRELSVRRFDTLDRAIADERAGRFDRAATAITDPKMQRIVKYAAQVMQDVRAEEVRLLRQRRHRAEYIEGYASLALGASLIMTLLLSLIVLPERRSRIQALWATKHALESALQAKKSFLAQMSHEIRTPMNGVLGFSELLLADELSPEQRRHAEMIDSSARAMMRLLNDILDFSKIDAGQMRIAEEPFDAAHAIDACARLVAPAAALKGVTLECTIAPSLPKCILGDGLRLRQIVLNLLGNAIKFTEQGGISVRAASTGSGEDLNLVLEVADTGIGIAPERQQAIFEKFVQADGEIAPRFGGTGLGLSITLQLVRLMRGTIELDSSPGKGSTFKVTLPIRPATVESKPASSPPPTPAASPGSTGRVLLVEDHDVNQELFIGMLSQLGWKVDLAENGAEAVRMAEDSEFADTPYKLVLMDMQMPVMDGLQATRRIRAAGISPDRLPILVLTANAYDSDIAACFAAGAQAHLPKPINMADLNRALTTWANTRGSSYEPPRPSVRELYDLRKTETLAALDEMAARGQLSDTDVARLGDMLHKLAGTAGMFGDGELGKRARALEVEIEGWTPVERDARLRAGVAAIKRAA